MKILDKLKNALFEEEYVEIEEKPVKQKKEKIKPKKDVNTIKEEKRLRNVKITNFESDEKKVEEEPIAKKILPVSNEVKEEVVEEELPVRVKREEFQFPAIEEDDFSNVNVDTENVKVTEIEDEISRTPYHDANYYQQEYRDEEYQEVDSNVKLYKTSKEDEYIKQYTANEYGNYEKVKEKKVFKPSPNISPIFGIIDDTKENVRPQPKKEVRLTSAVRNEKLDVDDVRRKAYGLTNKEKEQVSNDDYDDSSDDYDNMLVDLTDNSLPEVNKVTVGDAEEYFEDLGLEYDTDYIDAKKAKASGRRLKSEAEYESSKTEVIEDKKEVSEDVPDFLKEKYDDKSEEESDEDNLFDLIDSMYDK